MKWFLSKPFFIISPHPFPSPHWGEGGGEGVKC
jgi:hypothetical protein